jgi:type IV pilus assembly protein PilM
MSALALDLGTYTIKAVAGKPGLKVDVTRTAEVFNTLGFSVPTDDSQIGQLSQLINNLLSDHKFSISDVRLSLPESVVSTKVISIPPLSDAELASAIGWQAEQHIPIPPEELSLEYEVLYRPQRGKKDEQMRVLLVGVRKKVVDNYIQSFTQLGIEPTILETQLLSVVRSLQFEINDPPTLLVHIGANTMSIGMIQNGELVFIFNHMSGGQMLSKALQQAIGLDANQAEQYKRTYGLDSSQFQGKVRQALEPGVKSLTTEVVKAMRFYANQAGTESVQRVLLSGGTAQLPGFVQYVTEQVGVEVLVVAPFANATGAIPEINHTALSVCMGLLMRE